MRSRSLPAGGRIIFARLAGPGPAAESVSSGPLAPCDATATGSEDAQVRLTRGRAELFLCGHHFHVYELVLLAEGWRITQDNRRFLA